MPDLRFAVESARPAREGAALAFRMLVCDLAAEPTPIDSVFLHFQVRIQPARRRYSRSEEQKLIDLFDTPDRWGRTVRDIPWARVSTTLPAFAGETAVDLPVPCGRDPTDAATLYLDALDGGEAAMLFLFSGTVFYQAPDAGPHVAPIPWDREARYRLPVALWQSLFAEAMP